MLRVWNNCIYKRIEWLTSKKTNVMKFNPCLILGKNETICTKTLAKISPIRSIVKIQRNQARKRNTWNLQKKTKKILKADASNAHLRRLNASFDSTNFLWTIPLTLFFKKPKNPTISNFGLYLGQPDRHLSKTLLYPMHSLFVTKRHSTGIIHRDENQWTLREGIREVGRVPDLTEHQNAPHECQNPHRYICANVSRASMGACTGGGVLLHCGGFENGVGPPCKTNGGQHGAMDNEGMPRGYGIPTVLSIMGRSIQRCRRVSTPKEREKTHWWIMDATFWVLLHCVSRTIFQAKKKGTNAMDFTQICVHVRKNIPHILKHHPSSPLVRWAWKNEILHQPFRWKYNLNWPTACDIPAAR